MSPVSRSKNPPATPAGNGTEPAPTLVVCTLATGGTGVSEAGRLALVDGVGEVGVVTGLLGVADDRESPGRCPICDRHAQTETPDAQREHP